MLLQLLTLAAAADASSAAHGAEDAIKSGRTNGLGSILIPINDLNYTRQSTGRFGFGPGIYTKKIMKFLVPSGKISKVAELDRNQLDTEQSQQADIYFAKQVQIVTKIVTYDKETYFIEGTIEDFQNHLIGLVQKPERNRHTKRNRRS